MNFLEQYPDKDSSYRMDAFFPDYKEGQRKE